MLGAARRVRALQAHPRKLLEALRQLFELHWDYLLHLLRGRQVSPDGKSGGVRRQSASRQMCASVQPETSQPKSPAARCLCRGSKPSRVSFEHSGSFTVSPSVKANLSTRNRPGDVLWTPDICSWLLNVVLRNGRSACTGVVVSCDVQLRQCQRCFV